jgi:hypothetical protein
MAAVGVSGSPTKLEYWRGEGILPTNEREWRGRRGSASSASDAIKAQAIECARLVKAHHSTDVAALVLFARGYEVTESALRGVYHRFLNERREWIESHSAGDAIDASSSAAEAIARAKKPSKLVRRYRRRLKGFTDTAGETRDDALTSALADTLHAFLTGESIGGLQELLVASGLSATPDGEKPTSEQVNSLPVAQIESNLAAVDSSPDSLLRRAIDESTIEDFEHARDEMILMRDFAHAAATIEERTRSAITAPDGRTVPSYRPLAELAQDDLDVALLAPISLALRRGFDRPSADEWDELLAGQRVELPRYQAYATLLTAMPDDVGPYTCPLGVGKLQAMPAHERERIQTHIRRALRAHPKEAALLN